MRPTLLTIGIVAACMTACQSEPFNHSNNQTGSTGSGFQTSSAGSDSSPRSAADAAGSPAAYMAGQPIRWGQLRPLFAEAIGGEVLSEVVLGRQVDRALERAGMQVTEADLEREMDLLRAALDPDPNQAQRLINELRRREGLGPNRFEMMLRRNAGLRKLVQPEVTLSEEAIRRQYQLEYGPRYEVRLIVTDTFAAAGAVKRQLAAGQSFIDLAVRHSVDESRRQGGYLGEISPVDASYPAAVRRQIERLGVGGVSDPIALQRGFAIVKVEGVRPAEGVQLQQVREELTEAVRLQVEQMLMRQRARTMLQQADPTILDPALKNSWDQQRRVTELMP